MDLFQYRNYWEGNSLEHRRYIDEITKWNIYLKNRLIINGKPIDITSEKYKPFHEELRKMTRFYHDYFFQMNFYQLFNISLEEYNKLSHEKLFRHSDRYLKLSKAFEYNKNKYPKLSKFQNTEILERDDTAFYDELNSNIDKLYCIWKNEFYISWDYKYEFGDSIDFMPNLRYLVIDSPQHDIYSHMCLPDSFKDSIKGNTNLVGLSLKECRLQSIDFISDIPNLKYLDLSYNKSLPYNSNLGCYDSWAEEFGIRSLAPIRSCASLEKLNISYSCINDISPLNGMPNLKEIILKGNDWSLDDVKRIKRFQDENPNCIVDTDISEEKIFNKRPKNDDMDNIDYPIDDYPSNRDAFDDDEQYGTWEHSRK